MDEGYAQNQSAYKMSPVNNDGKPIISHQRSVDETVNRLTAASYAIPENLDINRLASKYEYMNAYAIIASSEDCYWVLPIPTSLSYDSDYQWAGEELSHGTAVAAGASNAVALMRNGEVMNALRSFGETTAGAIKTIPMWAARAGLQKLGDVSGVNGSQMLKEMERAQGIAYNPNQQLYFNGVELRDFSVTFSLSPTSKEEADAIKNGFRKLAYRAAPEYSVDRFYFEYPDFFKFAVVVNHNGDNNHHVMYSRAGLAITNLSLDLSPDSALTWHDDGFPTALQLSVSFKESVIPTRENLSKITLFGQTLG